MTDFVYVIKCEAGPVKVGVSDDPENRLRHLQGACPFELELMHTVKCGEYGSSAYRIEGDVHLELVARHLRGEWFSVSVQDAIEAIDLVLSGRGKAQLERDEESERVRQTLKAKSVTQSVEPSVYRTHQDFRKNLQNSRLKTAIKEFKQSRKEDLENKSSWDGRSKIKGESSLPAYLR